MLTKNKIYIGLIMSLFVALVIFQHFLPKPINWDLNFNEKNKSPYGCSVTFDLLKEIFKGKQIDMNTSSYYITLSEDSSKENNLIIITDSFHPDSLDLSSLLKFVAQGNNVFISALSYSDNICDTLHIKTNESFYDTSFYKKENSDSLHLFYNSIVGDSCFRFNKKMKDSYFSDYDSTRMTELGTDRDGNTNFLVSDFGNGRLFLHSQPLALTNYHILYGNYKYALSVLSFLPPRDIKWDQYYKPGSEFDVSPVRYILSVSTLRYAYYLVLITVLVYMIFGSKRKQRIIPVYTSEKNTSLDFIITIGHLYLKNKNHSDLVRKKIKYFHEYVRNHFYLQKLSNSKGYIELFSKKSGLSEDVAGELIQTVDKYEHKQKINRDELIEVHKILENFYKNCK